MERDSELRRIFRESGIQRAPEELTGTVMNRIRALPGKKKHKPLVGPVAGIIFFISGLGVALLALLGSAGENSLLDRLGLTLDVSWKFHGMERGIRELMNNNYLKVAAAVIVALFILVLLDRMISRRHLTI